MVDGIREEANKINGIRLYNRKRLNVKPLFYCIRYFVILTMLWAGGL
jgi:hypothetical protein